MKIFALSRVAFANLLDELTDQQKEQSAFISINEVDPLFVEFQPDSPNYLNLRFDDVEEDLPLLNGMKCVLFDENMANEIHEFVQGNLDKKAFFVHCTMGKCRSGAVAETLSDYFGERYEEFKRNNPQVQPNTLVKRILRNRFDL